MFLLKLLVFQGIQLLVRVSASPVETNLSLTGNTASSSTASYVINNEEEIINLLLYVKTYYEKIDNRDLLITDSIILDCKCGEKIQHIDVRKLEDIIFFILKKLNNYYIKTIPKEDMFLSNINYQNTFIDLFQSQYVHTICTRIPRCLDFIYICTPTMKKFAQILLIYSDLCYLREAYIKEYDNYRLSPSQNNENIILTTLQQNIFQKELISIYSDKITNEEDLQFITAIFELINKIDKKNMILSSDWKKKLLFRGEPGEFKIHMPQVWPEGNNTQKIHQIRILNHEIINIIDDQGNKFFRSQNLSDINESEWDSMNTCSSILSEVLPKFIQEIELIFRNNIIKQLPEKKIDSNYTEIQTISMYRGQIEYILMIDVLNDICKNISFILYHLSSNDINDSITFSLYSTMCSDWMHFLNVRCRYSKDEHGQDLYNIQCVKQSIIEKLMLNYYIVTQKTEGDEKMMTDEILTHIESLVTIIQNIHTALARFYMFKNIYIWTSFNWLVQIFTTVSQGSDYWNDIKVSKTMYASVSMPLMAIYNQLIPWNLNFESFNRFKSTINKSLLEKLHEYVWRQSQIIVLYVDNSVINYISDEVFQRLKISFKWFKVGAPVLFNILRYTEGYLKIPQQHPSSVTEIENASVDTIQQYCIATKHMKVNYVKSWKDEEIVGFVDTSTRLTNIFLKNCYDAVNFINNYISIINKSKIMKNNLDTYNFVELCRNDDLDNLFTPKKINAKNTIEPILIEDDDDRTMQQPKRVRFA
jgi:hypothetical protein